MIYILITLWWVLNILLYIIYYIMFLNTSWEDFEKGHPMIITHTYNKYEQRINCSFSNPIKRLKYWYNLF